MFSKLLRPCAKSPPVFLELEQIGHLLNSLLIAPSNSGLWPPCGNGVVACTIRQRFVDEILKPQKCPIIINLVVGSLAI